MAKAKDIGWLNYKGWFFSPEAKKAAEHEEQTKLTDTEEKEDDTTTR